MTVDRAAGRSWAGGYEGGTPECKAFCEGWQAAMKYAADIAADDSCLDVPGLLRMLAQPIVRKNPDEVAPGSSGRETPEPERPAHAPASAGPSEDDVVVRFCSVCYGGYQPEFGHTCPRTVL